MASNQTPLPERTRRIASTMEKLFSTHRFHHYYTPWGIASHYNGHEFIQGAGLDPQYASSLMMEAQRYGISLIDPPQTVPKNRDKHLFEELYCLTNYEAINAVTTNHATNTSYPIKSFFEDTFLIQEAATTYLQLPPSQEVQVDFFKFMVYYDHNSNQLQQKPHGSYKPLATRLLLRYGETNVRQKISEHIGDVASLLWEKNDFELYERQTQSSEEIRNLYCQTIGNGLHQQSVPKIAKVRIDLPGPRRVKQGAGVGVDWSDFFKNQSKAVEITSHFNKEELMRTKIRNAFITQYSLLFESDPLDVLHQINHRITQTTGVEQELLLQVHEVYALMAAMDTSPTLNHHLTISRGIIQK